MTEPYVHLRQIGTPTGKPQSGGQLLYVKSDGKVYTKNAAGTEVQVADSVDLSAHTSSTAVHGATGAVVGTTNTQTLTNKTLTSPTVTDPTVSVGGLTSVLPLRCTSATRPAHNTGLMIYETDTQKQYMSNGTAWITVREDTGWIRPTFQNSWVDFDTRVVAYRRLNGVVYLAGIAKSGTTPAVMFTLPAGYRPRTTNGQDMNIPVVANGALGVIGINQSGTVSFLTGSNAWVDLDAVSFVADN